DRVIGAVGAVDSRVRYDNHGKGQRRGLLHIRWLSIRLRRQGRRRATATAGGASRSEDERGQSRWSRESRRASLSIERVEPPGERPCQNGRRRKHDYPQTNSGRVGGPSGVTCADSRNGKLLGSNELTVITTTATSSITLSIATRSTVTC